MSQDPTIRCDACGADITSSGNSVDYRLVLAAQPKPSGGGVVTDLWITPPIDGVKHFCGLGCLGAWLAAKEQGLNQ